MSLRTIYRWVRKKNPFGAQIIIFRCLLALSSILTLIFLDDSAMNRELIAPMVTVDLGEGFNIFYLLGYSTGKVISILILMLVFTGFLPQLTGFLQLWINYSIASGLIIVEGGDQIALNLLLLTLPLCLVDPRRNQWSLISNSETSELRKIIGNTSLFFAFLQISIVYLHSGIGKAYQDQWQEGTALFYWFSHPEFGLSDGVRSLLRPILVSRALGVMGWLIMFFEIGLAYCLFAKSAIKRLFLPVGLLFHLGIILVHGLMNFSIIMMGALILYLDDGTFSTTLKHGMDKLAGGFNIFSRK